MSQRYKGGVISATPPTTSTSSASGVWTEQQFMQGVATGNWPALAGAPTIGTATAGALSASVTFTAPTYVGSGITGYTVTSNPGGITGTGASSPVTVSGLTAGTAYTFTVTATTAAGQGPASAASNSVTPTAPNYIEDVYSTYLYTPDVSNVPITINNGINLSANGGMVWFKNRSTGGSIGYNCLVDTVRGGTNLIHSNDVTPAYTASIITAFNSNGFTTGTSSFVTRSPDKMVGWTFQKKAKFFDIVTWSGNGVAGREIPHNLGSTPGCIIIKCLNAETNWSTWHRGTATNQVFFLNTSDASSAEGDFYATAPTSTVFTVNSFGRVNGSGFNYVAYVFAHDAGGFGLSGSENVISCGSCTADGSGNFSATLGYEPQWVLVKSVSTSRWDIFDNMRGVTASSGYNSAQRLNANLSDAEDTMSSPYGLGVSATGFTGNIAQGFGSDLIYIAIRRGPMKVPTSGTSMFTPVAWTGTSSPTSITGVGFPPDMTFMGGRNINSAIYWYDKLRGFGNTLLSTGTGSEFNTNPYGVNVFQQDGFSVGYDIPWNYTGYNAIYWVLRRAPSFFDEVCYTGTGSATTFAHNLGAVPELMIVKERSSPAGWWWNVYYGTANKFLKLNTTDAETTSTAVWNNTAPTSSVFSVGAYNPSNTSGSTYVAYLFATCAGVSKVGSYTGTAALLTVDCGFTSGARFVLIKRTDSTGDWYTYDSARGITSGNDPYLLLNSTAAEVTGTNYVDTDTTGFKVTAAAPAGLNASGGTYIFLAIA